MSYEVTTPVFEGPFDLLLHLILREQVELYEISLTKVVDAYLAELESMEQVNLEVATEFLLIAATLIELKTRRLLPGDDDLDLDDELSLWSERDLLLTRLVECKTFKDAAVVMERLAVEAGRSYPRVAGPDERFCDLAPDLLAGVTGEDLRAAFLRAVTPKPVPRIDLEHVAPIRASVAEAVQELIEELPLAGRISFRALTGGFVERLDVVVRFLAVLELFKQGFVDLDQPRTFADIQIVWLGRDRSELEELVAVDAYDG
ncbi:MAG TPA: ScpA family protein [Acidimicrobiales bacterium]|nr:ScpA family protein [Acidimicrobiales bacterium]